MSLNTQIHIAAIIAMFLGGSAGFIGLSMPDGGPIPSYEVAWQIKLPIALVITTVLFLILMGRLNRITQMFDEVKATE